MKTSFHNKALSQIATSLVVSLYLMVTLLTSPAATAATDDVALVTQVHGKALVEVQGAPPSDLNVFLKLRLGDRIVLSKDSLVQVVYFETGRQETWRDVSQFEIGSQQSKDGHAKPEVKMLPPILAKQLAKTPSAEAKNRAGMIRLRSIRPPSALEALESNYSELRAQTPADDLSPEMYLLAGLYEMKQFDLLSQALQRLREAPGDSESKQAIIKHYSQSLPPRNSEKLDQ